MTHTFQQIIENQSKYKSEIVGFLKGELADLRKELLGINTKNEYITEQKNKIQKKLTQTKFVKSIDSLFLLSKKRSEEYYVWWDTNSQEAIILTYGKK